MKILINCYACSPYKGSEPGMGWNFVKCLAKLHELHIITERKFEADINQYFGEHPEEMKYFNFYFIEKERHKKLRKIYPPSYYWFYQAWQKKAFELAKELDKKHNFDIIHQLNMIGYREPGYLYKLNKPFIWGPIGGFNITPWKLLPTMGMKGAIFYTCRNIINLYQMHHSKRVNEAMSKVQHLICATKDAQKAAKEIWNKEAIILPEVGLLNPISQIQPKSRENNESFRICWSGQHTPGKSLNFLLEAVSKCKNKENIELHILGKGEKTKSWQHLASKLKLKNTVWYKWLPKDKAVEVMNSCHIFVITSLADATSTVLLEALSLGLPVVALDLFGFSNVITANCGIKIAPNNRKQITEDLSKAIDLLYSQNNTLQSLSKGAFERAKEFSWNKKADIINQIYTGLVK